MESSKPMPEEDQVVTQGGISRSRFLQSAGLLAASGVLLNLAGCRPAGENRQSGTTAATKQPAAAGLVIKPPVHPVRVSADPMKIPPPIHRSRPVTHQILLETSERTGEIKPGVLFSYMMFNGQVPAPMIRVRQGDTLEVTVRGDPANHHPHNVDFHSCYGPGGGAEYTNVGPGQTRRIKFKAMDPGAFIYHCAVADLDFHISSGMYGLILVEPSKGLPPVDQEYYLGQNEIYIKRPADENTVAEFDYDALLREDPAYVVLNGAFHAITRQRYGPMKATKGQTARLYFVNGGPNLISSFHPIGNIWSKCWLQGSLANPPFHLMQTLQVNPGSCAILEMKFPVPETIHLADHSITRTARKGLLADIEVSGSPDPQIFQSLAS
ncbi:MAG TPA: copper-containing nitrite reductase [Chitinophagaceae bacterium]|nr:copper-containing nitrite reductase [Chitinophagaceae bacterium]